MKSAPVLETALAVGAYAEENRMGGGARGQEKKKRSRPRRSPASCWRGRWVDCLGYGIAFSIYRIGISPVHYLYYYISLLIYYLYYYLYKILSMICVTIYSYMMKDLQINSSIKYILNIYGGLMQNKICCN